MEYTNIEEIYKKYFKTVYKYLLTLTHNSDTAEDLTQETFCKVIQKINTFKGECKLSVWLCEIAKNLWLNQIKKDKRLVRIEDNDIAEMEQNIEEEFFERQQRKDLYVKIEKLDKESRKIFYLKLCGNMTFKEIGELLGRNEIWARVKFYRGKEKLKGDEVNDER